MSKLLLTYGDRTCDFCGGDGLDEDHDCARCKGTGELGEHTNHNFDLRPYMNPREFAEHLAGLFPPALIEDRRVA